MIVLAREVFLCKCATDVVDVNDAPAMDGASRDLRFVRGDVDQLALLDPSHHTPEHVCELRARLERGEIWLVGALGSRVATYTWLHTRASCEYPYLPGCAFDLPVEHAFGYDAWTAPDLRGVGLRRRAFVEELRWLRSLGKRWESSFFVAHQLDGARRSLGLAGVQIAPVWRVALGHDRRLVFERLRDEPGITPRQQPR
jgi:hypothetical protein